MLSSARWKSLGHISLLMLSHLNLIKVSVIVSDGNPLKPNMKITLMKRQEPLEGGDFMWPTKAKNNSFPFTLQKQWNTCPAGGSFNSQMKFVASVWFSTPLKLNPPSLIKFSRDKTKLACWEKCKKERGKKICKIWVKIYMYKRRIMTVKYKGKKVSNSRC